MSQSAFFAQLLSDVLGAPVETARVLECSALGAAICAGVGARLYGDIATAAKRHASATRRFAPDPGRSSAYQSYYARLDGSTRSASTGRRAAAESGAIEAIFANAAKNTPRGALANQTPRPNILVTAALDEEGLAALRKLGDVRYESFREHLRLLTGEDLVEALAGVQVFITEVDAVDTEVLSKAPDLRVVACCRGNAVNIDIDACTAHGVLVLDDAGSQCRRGRGPNGLFHADVGTQPLAGDAVPQSAR